MATHSVPYGELMNGETGQDPHYEQKLRSRLGHGEITSNLLRLALRTVLYELIKVDVAEQVRSFFVFGFDQDGDILSPEYETKVLSLHKNRGEASLLWLKSVEALDDDDIELVKQLRVERNNAAHEGMRLLLDPNAEFDDDLVEGGAAVLEKLGRFWGGISADSDPQFDGVEVDYDEIRSMQSVAFEHVREVAEAMFEVGRQIDLSEDAS